jgi:hypothetical protein
MILRGALHDRQPVTLRHVYETEIFLTQERLDILASVCVVLASYKYMVLLAAREAN